CLIHVAELSRAGRIELCQMAARVERIRRQTCLEGFRHWAQSRRWRWDRPSRCRNLLPRPMVAGRPGIADRAVRATGSDPDRIPADITGPIAGTAALPATGGGRGDIAGIRPITGVCPTAPGNPDHPSYRAGQLSERRPHGVTAQG